MSKIVLSLGLTSLIVSSSLAFFVPRLPTSSLRQQNLINIKKSCSDFSALKMSTDVETESGKKLTSEEILARSKAIFRKDEEAEEVIKVFDDETYNAIQRSVDILQRRIDAGPGSLSESDIETIEKCTNVVVSEMKEKFASSVTIDAPVAPAATVSVPAPAPASIPVSSTGNDDYNPEEGEKYDGTGGMGLAKGTANTYVIPGMDEMTGEEYRKALQASVTARQTQRYKNRGGIVGNRAAHDYLSSLGYGGASKSLSHGKDNEEQ